MLPLSAPSRIGRGICFRIEASSRASWMPSFPESLASLSILDRLSEKDNPLGFGDGKVRFHQSLPLGSFLVEATLGYFRLRSKIHPEYAYWQPSLGGVRR